MSTSQSKAELVKRAIARRELDRKRFSEDPFAYIFEAVQTKDEHDSQNPVKAFPKKEYLFRVLDTWHNGESVEFLIKSRQLVVTWLACAYISWVARYQPHRLIFVQSKKEEDAANLVFHTHSAQARLSFIETHLPEYLRIKDLQYAYGKVIYPNGSRVQAIPQGPTHYESYVPSLVFNDEASLQDEWAAGHAALKPCIEGGGKCITVATVRMPSAYSQELALEGCDTEPVCKGITRYRTQSGVAASALHYSADPDKDPETEVGSAWYKRAIAGYPGGPDGHLWRQHMELDFEATSSTKLIPFFDEYERVLTIPDIPPEQQMGWKYYAGFDYGKRNKTVFGVYAIAPDGTRYVCWELAAPGDDIGGIPGITKSILDCPYFEDVRHNIRADPTIWNDNQARTGGGYTSIAQLLSMEGIYLQKAPVKGNAADEIAIERLLHYYWVDPEEPKLFMFRSCQQHIKQFKGLRYQDWSAAVQAERAYKEELVDRQNDCFDDQTEILTDTGWKHFKDLTYLDKVATRVDGELVFEVPKRIIDQPYTGPMYLYEKNINFCVSPNHNHFVADQYSTIRKKHPDFQRVPVTELPATSWVPRTAEWGAPDLESPIPGISADNLIAFIGFWLAEGCKDCRTTPYCIVGQRDPDDELRTMMRDLGLPYLESTSASGVTRFRVRSWELFSLLPDAHSWDKRVPRWLMGASRRQLEILLYWMMKGDGSWDMRRYNTVSPGLANDVQEIALKIGVVASLSIQPARMVVLPNGGVTGGRPMYHVQLQSGKPGQGGRGRPSLLAQIRRAGIRKVDYSGRIYCVDTTSGVIFVRRHGKPMWSGNCWDAWKYAECARPSPTVLASRPPVGSVEHIRRKMVAEKHKPRRVRSRVVLP